MNVTSHRSPYPRIGRAEPVVASQRDLPNLVSYSPTEAERVWKLLRQCAEGCNQVGSTGE